MRKPIGCGALDEMTNSNHLWENMRNFPLWLSAIEVMSGKVPVVLIRGRWLAIRMRMVQMFTHWDFEWKKLSNPGGTLQLQNSPLLEIGCLGKLLVRLDNF